MPSLVKNATNPHFKNTYISLDQALDAILPVLRSHKILFMQPLSAVGPEPAIVTRFVFLPTGEELEFSTPLVLGKVGPQDWGSSITYARRYALLAALGLTADEDDDAEKSSPTPARKAAVSDVKAGSAGITGGGF